jgi:hypothetical protein
MHAHQLGTIAARTAAQIDVEMTCPGTAAVPTAARPAPPAAFQSASKSCQTRNGDGCEQLSTEQQKTRGAQHSRIDLIIIANWRLAASLGGVVLRTTGKDLLKGHCV